MTDKEIIKALECCKKDDCDNCPNNFGNCHANLARYALDLINRYETEIYMLKEDIEAQDSSISSLLDIVNSNYQNGRTDASREFAERLTHTLVINNEENTEYFDFAYTLETIDAVKKEMMEE